MKRILGIALSLLLIAQLFTGGALSVAAAGPEDDPFGDISLTLGGELGINISAYYGTGPGTMTFTLSGAQANNDEFTNGKCVVDMTSSVEGLNWRFDEDRPGYVIFTCHINALQMNQDITVSYQNDYGTYALPAPITVKQYIDALKKKCADDTALITLLDATADYGHYVQLALQETNHFTLGEGADYRAMPAAAEYYLPTASYLKGISEPDMTGTLNGFIKKTMQLDLEYKTSFIVNFYISKDQNYTADAISAYDPDGVKIPSDRIKVEVSDYSADQNKYKVSITGISAENLGREHTLCFGGISITASPLGYGHLFLNADPEKRPDYYDSYARMLGAMYRYYTAACAYAAQ